MQWKLAVPLVVFLCAPAFAQSGGVATISGTVHDPSGAVVPNAKVVIWSASQGQVRSIQTNSAGVFSAAALIPGPGYSVAVTAPGFAENDSKDIDLQVGQNLNLSINLTVAQSATQVEVSSAAELIDDQKTDVSTAVGQQQINELPINGRRVDSFVLLTPGVTNDATFGLLSFRGVAGNNSFLIDGNDNTEQFYDENAGRTRIQSQVSRGRRFRGVSGCVRERPPPNTAAPWVAWSTPLPRAAATIVHGSAFYYFCAALASMPTIPMPRSIPPSTASRRGGTVGGAIIKNKLLLTS